jgi:two-component system, NarL family, sensor histidine kinase UhpB
MDSTGRTSAAVRRPAGTRRYAPLTRRVVATNAAVLVAVAIVTVLVFSPGRVSSLEALTELAILTPALVVMGLLNLVLMRRALLPIERLRDFVREVDPLRPGQRAPVPGRESEAAELAGAFNEMLGRLERERLDSVRMALAAQEAERLRVAQELHDEVGQSLTAVLLQLGRLGRSLSPGDAPVLADAQETARDSLHEVRRIARSLRPEALDDLGLLSALRVLAERVEEQGTVRVGMELGRDLPPLDDEEELVIYRVAQEALTNVVRHSGARLAELRLETSTERVRLAVRDDGAGLGGGAEGAGIRGMRERAALVGAELRVGDRTVGGVELVLDLPLDGRTP